MPRHGRRWPIALVLGALALSTTMVATPLGASTRTGVRVSFAPKSASVRVQWVFPKTDGTITRVEIQRGKDAAHLVALTTISVPRHRGNYIDASPVANTSVYRAREVIDGVPGTWSDPATVIAPPPLAGPAPLPPGITECPAGHSDQVVALTNQLREARALPPLRVDSRLASAARVHNVWMLVIGSLQHETRAYPGRWAREIYAAGYSGGIGENIAAGFATPAAVMSAWEGDAGHLSNLVRSWFVAIGVDCVLQSNGVAVWTQNFGG